MAPAYPATIGGAGAINGTPGDGVQWRSDDHSVTRSGQTQVDTGGRRERPDFPGDTILIPSTGGLEVIRIFGESVHQFDWIPRIVQTEFWRRRQRLRAMAEPETMSYTVVSGTRARAPEYNSVSGGPGDDVIYLDNGNRFRRGRY